MARSCSLALTANVEMAFLVLMGGPVVLAMVLLLMLFSEHKTARAGSCQSYEAAYNLEARLVEGLSLNQAKQSVIQDEYSDGSPACWSAIKHEINQMPYAFPLVHRALYKRMRR